MYISVQIAQSYLSCACTSQNTCKPVGHQYQGHIRKQRVLMHKVYQRAKANEIAMRSLLPHGIAIERPSFKVCEESISPHPIPTRHVLPPLPKHLHPDSTMPDSQTALKHSIKNQELELRCLQETRGSRYSGKGTSLQLHPLAVKVTASKENLVSSSHGLSPSSKPICVPLTMSDLMESRVTKVYN